MSTYQTKFGSLQDINKGRVELVDDDAKNYVFSNIFEVCAKAQPYERVAVAKNFEYVIEACLASGTSGWFSAGHDEFVLCMDGSVEVHLVKLDRPDAAIDPELSGAQAVKGEVNGAKMGRLVLGRGHMGLLPKGAAYRFHSAGKAALMLQTIDGPLTRHKWADICQTS
jgi:hypothetical protein